MKTRVSLDTDQGCYLASSCLNCHLPKCKEDMTKDELTEWRRSQRADHIRAIYDTQRANHPNYQQNMLTWLTAKKAQVSRRTVQRALATTREQSNPSNQPRYTPRFQPPGRHHSHQYSI